MCLFSFLPVTSAIISPWGPYYAKGFWLAVLIFRFCRSQVLQEPACYSED